MVREGYGQDTMHTFLYIVWFSIPAFFFLASLWAKLEVISNKGKKENPTDLLRQGIFVLVCALVAVGIDRYVLSSIVTSLSPSWLPLGFYQTILLPLLLLLGAKITGGTKEIRIEKAPRPSLRKKK